MPLNSAEIAQAAGQFQQFHVGQQQYSTMIGGMAGLQGAPGVQADQIAGGLMNRMSAVGAPIASLGMGLLGMDPMSIGIKAGMGAYASGAGLAGAGMLGLGAAGAVAVPMAMAQYAAGQMWTGAQGQQAFNQNMRGAFAFQTPYGQGFSGGQLGQMNQGLFNMAGQRGGAGEMMGINELQGLAANMGRMGMGSGIKDVSQFSQKFREMVDTLKVVAKEMGTSMQAAQEFVVAMRGSGIFNSGDQRRLATEIRQFAQAGNMATSELTAAANIGAQVSRAIGGRGNQGAFAGVRTIGQIGAAMQAGVLNDEDLYNATGLTGAEGRQALAARQLEQSGNFLRSGRGRMFLASVAGAGGQLDPNSVQDWLSGGMDIAGTRGLAKGNLNRLGKAGFLRNEGRLRGAALEQFGGMLPTMALMQWAGGRGMDINTMDDKSMLFASRSLGMGMDELEDAVKMARNMPAILEQQRSSKEMGSFNNRMATVRRTQGIEGVQRRFEDAREKVQGSLQRVGAQFYTDLSSMIERTINEMTGVAVEEYDQKVMDAYHDAMSGAGTRGLQRQLGLGARGGMRGIGASSLGGMTQGSGVDRFFGRPSGGLGGAAFQATRGSLAGALLFGGESDFDRMEKAGYGSMFRGISSTEELQKRVNAVQGAYTAAQTARQEDVALGKKLRSDLRTEYAVGDMQSARGGDRVDRLAQILGQKAAAGDKDAQAALQRLTSASSKEERLRVGMQMLTGVETGAGIARGARTVDLSAPPDVAAALGGGFATADARDAAYGAAFMGRSGVSKGLIEHSETTRTLLGYGALGQGLLFAGKAYSGKRRGQVDSILGKLGPVGDAVKGALGDVLGTTQGLEQDQAIGEYLNSSEGKSLIQGVYAGDSDSRGKIEDMLAQPNLPAAKREALKGMLAASAATDLIEKAQKEGRAPTEAEWQAVARAQGMSVNDLKQKTTMVGGIAGAQADQARRQLIREVSKDAMSRSRSLQVSGFAKVDDAGNLSLSADVAGIVQKTLGAGSGTVLAAMKAQLGVTQKQAALGMGATGQEIMDLAGQYGAAETDLMNLSVSDQMKLARSLEAGGYGDQAAQFRGMAGNKRRIEGALKKGGGVQALGSALGIGFKSRAELQGLQKLAGTDANAAVGQLLSKAGLSADSLSAEDRAELATALKNKDVNALSNIASGKGDLGRRVQGAISEEARKKSEQSARDQNPLMDKVEQHLKALSDALTPDGAVGSAIVDTSRASKGILSNTRKESDTETGTTTAPKP